MHNVSFFFFFLAREQVFNNASEISIAKENLYNELSATSNCGRGDKLEKGGGWDQEEKRSET
jgi:hypothetical protein